MRVLSGKFLSHSGEKRPHQWTYRLHLHMPIENPPQLVLLIEHRLVNRLIPRVRLPHPVQQLDLLLPQLTDVVCAPCLDERGAIPPERGGIMWTPARAQQGDPPTADRSHLPQPS